MKRPFHLSQSRVQSEEVSILAEVFLLSEHIGSLVIIALVVLYGLYRRFQRTIGFQPVQPRRMLTRAIILGLVGVLVLAAGALHPILYAYDAIGAALGAILAYYGIRTTSFERRGSKWFYRPHPWIGAILLVLFLGRIFYRFYADYGSLGTNMATTSNQTASPTAVYAHDPLATAVLFTIVVYYAAYTTFVVRAHRGGRLTDKRQAEHGPSED